MRVAYFSESLPPLTDGVVRTLSQLIETLHQQGVEFSVFSPIEPERTLWWRDKVRQVPSVPFLLYDYYRMGIPVRRDLDAALDAFQPDLIHPLNPTLIGMYAIKYARRRGLPVVSSYHTRFVSYLPYYGLSALAPVTWSFLTWFYNNCDMTYAPTPTAARELNERGVEAVELWERGIDTERFSPTRRDEALRAAVGAADKALLLFVGRLVREKNLAELAEAASLLREWGIPYKLALLGDGPMRADLERRLPDAHFGGFVHGVELARWYASSDLFVFPSTTETFGNVVMEAFASGVPAVVAREGGVQDLVSAGVNGLIAAPRDGRDFADKVASLIRNDEYRRTLSAGALHTAGRYRWPAVNGRLLGSYTRVIDRAAQVRPAKVA